MYQKYELEFFRGLICTKTIVLFYYWILFVLIRPLADFKIIQEWAGEALHPCTVSSPSHTCCCSGVHHARSGGPGGWSCKQCRSTEECGQTHKQRSRLKNPSGHRCSWSDEPQPRSPRSGACCGARRRQQSGTSTRCRSVCGPRWSRSHLYDGTDPSGGWWSGRCSIQQGRAPGQ